MRNSLIQIVPALPPRLNGVGDHALAVARALRVHHGISTHFVVGDPSWQGPEEIDGFHATKVSERSAVALMKAVATAAPKGEDLLLQLSPYGYDRNGCPSWLLQGFQQFTSSNPGARLITYFHELFATSAPWRKAFWFSPLQRRISKGLLNVSACALTSNQSFASQLHAWNPHSPIDVIPVLSSIGEPHSLRPLHQRTRRLVLFGNIANRADVLDVYRSLLLDTCRSLEVEELRVIGGEATGSASFSVKTVVTGHSPSDEVSELLQDSVGGFLAYPPNLLGKSAVFAAYCAHGVVPVNTGGATDEHDGLRLNREYWSPVPEARRSKSPDLQSIADNAAAWYGTHSVRRHAEVIATRMSSEGLLSHARPQGAE